MSALRAYSTAIALVTVVLLGAVATATGQSKDIERQRQRKAVERLLDAPHPQISAHDLRRIGTDVAAILLQMAATAHTGRHRGVRALALLRHYPSSATRTALSRVARSATVATRIRRIAITGLGSIPGTRARDDVALLLDDRDLYIREACAYALAKAYAKGSVRLLERRLTIEKEQTVRAAIRSSLSALEKRRRQASGERGKPSRR